MLRHEFCELKAHLFWKRRVAGALKKDARKKNIFVWVQRKAPRGRHAIGQAMSLKRMLRHEFCALKAHIFWKRCVVRAQNKGCSQKKSFSLQWKKKARARHTIAQPAWVKWALRDEFCELKAHIFWERCVVRALTKGYSQKKSFSLQWKKKARARHAIAQPAWVKWALRDECFEFGVHLFWKRCVVRALNKATLKKKAFHCNEKKRRARRFGMFIFHVLQ
jgi:hypothetical protein